MNTLCWADRHEPTAAIADIVAVMSVPILNKSTALVSRVTPRSGEPTANVSDWQHLSTHACRADLRYARPEKESVDDRRTTAAVLAIGMDLSQTVRTAQDHGVDAGHRAGR